MGIADILSPARTQCDAPGSSKKRALHAIADFIAQDIPELDPATLFKQLTARERLGSTGIGHGIAIPHCRMEKCPSINGALVRLAEPVDFDSYDNQPVDLLFVLLVPEQACDEHLQVLKKLAQLFSQVEFRAALRSAHDRAELYDIAIDYEQQPHCPGTAEMGRG